MSIQVKVPATTANLGPGFDALGMALNLYNFVEIAKSGSSLIEVAGEGADQLPRDATNIVAVAVQEVFRAVGRAETSLSIRLNNRIPLARGLGSSAAARVGVMVAVNRMCGDTLSEMELLALATGLEGHPDNVAPALLGGLVISSVEEDGSVHCVRAPVSDPPSFVVLIPDAEVSTEEARSSLPNSYSRSDTCFNISRASLLVGALMTGHHEVLRVALRDKIHQPYRAKIMPWFNSVVDAATESGAHGAVLSGAGSCILAMTPEDRVDAVGSAMLTALRNHRQQGRYLNLKIDTDGARVVE
ncbi:MAG: homoserine kinase [Armatimonadetes bacterium CG2_30_59_28]|nr:homoserine kinase [Armatimonadota bacterium]OIO93618.1 MAG: homoserine kinase [Armatimonadetes bacterium CG2_30_59_28]PIU66271.1 MAG: homoserine kinase [Armatimonadetes bacterium CG07_land_8_20_14_0_80_59_28]PIX40484.1 MAG: homoserine kinase [Armatimonadetes bacterium CG_4_8_14_3_um_filter_58_9]PIY41771.1 MAG: homoserine kinase [Armatimonadetes bacterium CG_4_10_14_3_um_filter_59_10]